MDSKLFSFCQFHCLHSMVILKASSSMSTCSGLNVSSSIRQFQPPVEAPAASSSAAAATQMVPFVTNTGEANHTVSGGVDLDELAPMAGNMTLALSEQMLPFNGFLPSLSQMEGVCRWGIGIIMKRAWVWRSMDCLVVVGCCETLWA